MIISFHPTAQKAAAAQDGWRLFNIGNMDTLAEIIMRRMWSNIVWTFGKRRSDYFDCSHFMALDFDDPETSLSQAIKEWCDTKHVIGITKSHQKEKNGIVCDRFRIVAPWSEAITKVETYKQNQQRLINIYKSDPACKGGAQLFFPCVDIVSIQNDGETIDVVPPLRIIRPAASRKRWFIPPQVQLILESVAVPKGERNNTFFKAAMIMLEAGLMADQVYDAIINSPTYKIKTNSDEKEIAALVQSAAKTFERHNKE